MATKKLIQIEMLVSHEGKKAHCLYNVEQEDAEALIAHDYAIQRDVIEIEIPEVGQNVDTEQSDSRESGNRSGSETSDFIGDQNTSSSR